MAAFAVAGGVAKAAGNGYWYTQWCRGFREVVRSAEFMGISPLVERRRKFSLTIAIVLVFALTVAFRMGSPEATGSLQPTDAPSATSTPSLTGEQSASPYPTEMCQPDNLGNAGVLHGDPDTPDRVTFINEYDDEFVLPSASRGLYQFTFEPDLRVINVARGVVVATEGDVVGAGGELVAGTENTFELCGLVKVTDVP